VLVVATGWMVGVSVALAGAIGFIGLVIPIFCVCVASPTIACFCPPARLRGDGTAGADIVARMALSAAELPIGVVTATLGAPVFIWLYNGKTLKGRRTQCPDSPADNNYVKVCNNSTSKKKNYLIRWFYAFFGK
jgi:ABC-type enterochelin transport system permease subunit